MPKASELLANFDRHHLFPDVAFNVNAEILAQAMLDLAESGRGETKRKAKDLVNQMAEKSWWVAAGAHQGGLGGGGHAPDPRAHITIRIAGAGHHVYYTLKGGSFRVVDVS